MKQHTVLFVSKGEQASSTRYRALNYFPLFRENGWEPQHVTDDKSRASHRQILEMAAKSDAVVVLRRAPGGLYGVRLRQVTKRLIFDFDDAIFVPRSGRFSRRPARFRSMVRRCDYVWAGNSYLANEALRFNSNVFIVPTSIEIDRYLPVAGKPRGETVLVWIGSRSTSKYLIDMLPVLERACAGIAGVRLKIIADFDLHSDVLRIDNLTWSQVTEISELANSNIGIAPMPDDPWTRGKCGLKVLQYMASNLPVITSPFGVNRDLVDDGVTGFHALTEHDWTEAIHRLAAHPDLAETMGNAGRKKCEAGYTLQKTFNVLLHTLEN